MMDRRSFMGVTAASGAAVLAAGEAAAKDDSASRYIELRRYEVASPEQKDAVAAFYKEAAIPALNRAGVQPVGIFELETAAEPNYIYAILPHKSLESFADVQHRLLADDEYQSKGAAFLDAPAETPAFVRVETTLMSAFTGMPNLAVPTEAPGRILQLRIYQSPSIKTGQKKIEMFNVKEIEIFNKVGLAPVFFGETIAGPLMPNLTYALAFDSNEAKDAAWQRFLADPDWLELKAIPDYADKKILSGIINIILKPLPGSQI